MKLLFAIAALALSGCASTADIDLSKVDSPCAQQCTANHSSCLSNFTLFPIVHQSACNDSLRLCAQSCPARKPI